MPDGLRQQLLDTSRGRIVVLLRRGGLTVDDIARALGVTPSAVRIQITAMERDGLVRRVGKKARVTRPSHIFELTAGVEQLLSNAYVPLLTGLVDVFADALPADQLESLLRRTGVTLARQLARGQRLSGGLRARAASVSQMLNEQLGAVTHVEANGSIVILGAGCPLAALTGKHKGVCLALESLVSELVGVPVRECCDRADRPKCRFEIRRPRQSL